MIYHLIYLINPNIHSILVGVYCSILIFWIRLVILKWIMFIWCFDPACFIGVDGWGVCWERLLESCWCFVFVLKCIVLTLGVSNWCCWILESCSCLSVWRIVFNCIIYYYYYYYILYYYITHTYTHILFYIILYSSLLLFLLPSDLTLLFLSSIPILSHTFLCPLLLFSFLPPNHPLIPFR